VGIPSSKNSHQPSIRIHAGQEVVVSSLPCTTCAQVVTLDPDSTVYRSSIGWKSLSLDLIIGKICKFDPTAKLAFV
jgi:hypothetical protein